MALPILLAQFRATGIQSLASSAHASAENDQPLLAPWEVDWRQPVALLIGNEGAGLPEEIERSADARIRIPMSSSVESLNAAAAAAVLFYEAARQRSSVA
jgi:TrmH family RNA methyltransferase